MSKSTSPGSSVLEHYKRNVMGVSQAEDLKSVLRDVRNGLGDNAGRLATDFTSDLVNGFVRVNLVLVDRQSRLGIEFPVAAQNITYPSTRDLINGGLAFLGLRDGGELWNFDYCSPETVDATIARKDAARAN